MTRKASGDEPVSITRAHFPWLLLLPLVLVLVTALRSPSLRPSEVSEAGPNESRFLAPLQESLYVQAIMWSRPRALPDLRGDTTLFRLARLYFDQYRAYAK